VVDKVSSDTRLSLLSFYNPGVQVEGFTPSQALPNPIIRIWDNSSAIKSSDLGEVPRRGGGGKKTLVF
jgi:hypothetical protein